MHVIQNKVFPHYNKDYAIGNRDLLELINFFVAILSLQFLRHKSESAFELKMKVKKNTVELGLLSFKPFCEKQGRVYKFSFFFFQYSQKN